MKKKLAELEEYEREVRIMEEDVERYRMVVGILCFDLWI